MEEITDSRQDFDGKTVHSRSRIVFEYLCGNKKGKTGKKKKYKLYRQWA